MGYFYELAFWIKINSQLEEEVAKIINLIKKYNGEILYNSETKKRQLAYPIQKEHFGYFGYLLFKVDKNFLKEINENLRFYKNILRFLIIKRKVLFPREQIIKNES